MYTYRLSMYSSTFGDLHETVTRKSPMTRAGLIRFARRYMRPGMQAAVKPGFAENSQMIRLMVEDRYGIENVKVVCSTRCRPRSTTTKS